MIYDKEDLYSLMNGPLGLLHGCIGTPVIGNPTQYMMERAFHHQHLSHRYLTFDISADHLRGAMDGLKHLGFNGWNITSPHKVKAAQFVDSLTPSAELIGAINCVYREGNRYIGENTDGKGFLTAVSEHMDVRGKDILIFGSGGAARSIICELALKEASSITIVNRDIEKAERIRNDLRDKVLTRLHIAPLGNQFTITDRFHLIIQATSVGLFAPEASLPVTFGPGNFTGCVACDVVFNPVDTRFLLHAEEAGCRKVDGLGMLAHQGAIIYTTWTGSSAPVDIMKQAIIESFAG